MYAWGVATNIDGVGTKMADFVFFFSVVVFVFESVQFCGTHRVRAMP